MGLKNLTRFWTLAISAVAVMAVLLILAPESADARARFGGRSFSRSRSFSRPATPRKTFNYNRTSPGSFSRRGSSSFMRGLGGGLLGGFLGSMFFGRPAYGMGGFGGSGIGLFELLIFGGIAWFLFKRLARPAAPRGPDRFNFQSFGETDSRSASPVVDIPPAGPGARGLGPDTDSDAARGIAEIRRSDPRFDPALFKEGAQDIFFKVQAAWMRRDLSSVQGIIGSQLAEEYRSQFDDMRANGTVNRLENIAVRSLDIVDAGIEAGYAFVVVDFTANLLDYTVEEATGRVLSGSDSEPVKFQERWTFGAPVNTSDWRLEGIEQA